MNKQIIIADNIALQSNIKQIFADVTRYPEELLDLEANLEEDLGIDSVKLGEIFSVIRSTYNLPSPEDFPVPKEALTTIGNVINFLQEHINANISTASESKVHDTPLSRLKQKLDNDQTNITPVITNGLSVSKPLFMPENFKKEIIEIFAEVTRYPIELLDVNANLEEDLGIDSVKLGEIFAVFREKYQLPSPEEMSMPREALSSITAITNALVPFVVGNTNYSTEGLQHKTATMHIKADETFLREFMQYISGALNIPQQLLRPDDLLEVDLNFDEQKLNQTLINLDTRYALSPGLYGRPMMQSFKTLRDLANAIVELKNMPHKLNGSAARPEAKPKPVRTLEGKVCFISGSGQGLGKVIASYLAEQGATVIINSFHSRIKGIETEKEIRDKGGKVHHIWGSMANPEQIEKIFDEIENKYGGIDFFIANAANGMLAKLEDITLDDWKKAFMTGVVGMQIASVRAMKMMKKRGGGKIITLSTPAAHGYSESYGCMAAIKSAVESLTRYMAVEFAPYNIQVNCVSPGPIYGDLINKWPDSERIIKLWENKIPAGRLVKPEEVASFIAYLLSEQAQMFTGGVTVLDGGISIAGN